MKLCHNCVLKQEAENKNNQEFKNFLQYGTKYKGAFTISAKYKREVISSVFRLYKWNNVSYFRNSFQDKVDQILTIIPRDHYYFIQQEYLGTNRKSWWKGVWPSNSYFRMKKEVVNNLFNYLYGC